MDHECYYSKQRTRSSTHTHRLILARVSFLTALSKRRMKPPISVAEVLGSSFVLSISFRFNLIHLFEENHITSIYAQKASRNDIIWADAVGAGSGAWRGASFGAGVGPGGAVAGGMIGFLAGAAAGSISEYGVGRLKDWLGF